MALEDMISGEHSGSVLLVMVGLWTKFIREALL